MNTLAAAVARKHSHTVQRPSLLCLPELQRFEGAQYGEGRRLLPLRQNLVLSGVGGVVGTDQNYQGLGCALND